MFGIGGSEIIVILIVALLFLGPDKLPEATKLVSKGIRDLKKQQRMLQQTIENDEQIGGAIRDLKSALRGEEEPVRRPPVRKEPPKEAVEGANAAEEAAAAEIPTIMPPGHDAEGRLIEEADKRGAEITLPEMAGEPDLDTANGKSEGDEDLAKLIKPAASAIAKSAPEPVAKPELPVTKPLSPVRPAAKLPPPRPTPPPRPAPTVAEANAAVDAARSGSDGSMTRGGDEPETVKARPAAKTSKTDG